MSSRAERRRLERELAKVDPLTSLERERFRRWQWRRPPIRLHFERHPVNVAELELESDAVRNRVGLGPATG